MCKIIFIIWLQKIYLLQKIIFIFTDISPCPLCLFMSPLGYYTFKEVKNRVVLCKITSFQFEWNLPVHALHTLSSCKQSAMSSCNQEHEFASNATILMALTDRFIILITGIITAEVKDSDGEFPQLCLQADEWLPPGAISWLLTSCSSVSLQFIYKLQFHWTFVNYARKSACVHTLLPRSLFTSGDRLPTGGTFTSLISLELISNNLFKTWFITTKIQHRKQLITPLSV
jgi:hypothetical protein